MKAEDQIDELIMAGWWVVDSDFDPVAFDHWRLKAFDCLTAMFGPDHVYAKYFEHFVEQGGRTNVLAGGGVLVTAKEQVKGMECTVSEPLWRPRVDLAPHRKAGDSMTRQDPGKGNSILRFSTDRARMATARRDSQGPEASVPSARDARQ